MSEMRTNVHLDRSLLEKQLPRLTAGQRSQIVAQIAFHLDASESETVELSNGSLRLLVVPGTTRPMSSKMMAYWLSKNPSWVEQHRVLDMGCGTGMLGITSLMFGASECVLTDISEQALTSSSLNAAAFVRAGTALVLRGDLFENVPIGMKFSRILFNHPYFGDEPLEDFPFTRGMLNSGELLTRFFDNIDTYATDDAELLMMRWSFAGATNDAERIARSAGWRVAVVDENDLVLGIQRGFVETLLISRTT